MFDRSTIDLGILKSRAYNSRWATLPEDVIPLTAADPDLPCAPEINEAICRYAKDQYLGYGPYDGMPEFKESLASYYREKRQVPADPDLIFPVNSAAYGIYLTCQTILSSGDEAIVFDPVDYLFRYSIEHVGGRATTFSHPPGSGPLDAAKLEACIGPKTKMICLCNPLNPTGKVFSKNELQEIGELACKHDLIILSDEIWSDIIFKPNTYTCISSLDQSIRNRTVTVTGFSKSYGIAGLRIGAVMTSDQELYKNLLEASLHKSTIGGANILGQVAATAALEECEYWLNDFIAHLEEMKQLCVQELNSVPGFECIPPQGCYVAFVNVAGTGKSETEIQQILQDEAKVAVVPGRPEWFGDNAKDHIRLSFATSKEILQKALSRINQTIRDL